MTPHSKELYNEAQLDCNSILSQIIPMQNRVMKITILFIAVTSLIGLFAFPAWTARVAFGATFTGTAVWFMGWLAASLETAAITFNHLHNLQEGEIVGQELDAEWHRLVLMSREKRELNWRQNLVRMTQLCIALFVLSVGAAAFC